MADNHNDDLDIQDPEFEYAYAEDSDPDSGYYGTGSTKPPKDHAGVVAVVLVLLILCSGLLTALGLMDIHPFAQQQTAEPKTSVRFSEAVGELPQGLEQQEPLESSPSEPSQVPTCPVDGDAHLQLKPTPAQQQTEQSEQSEQSEQEEPQQAQPLTWQQVYEKMIPSVVSITTTAPGSSSSGTGVIMNDSGYIITNAHVVENAAQIRVLLTDGREFQASQVGIDPISDLAVLYIQADNLTAAEFGDSSALRVGDSVVAIGDPLGIQLRGTMTDGMISAINRDLKIGGKSMTLLQTTAALNAGNSGGPLVNHYGQVIGINTMKIGDYASVSGVEGLGFAIPMTTVKGVVEQLMTNGYISGRPTLGIKGQMLSTFYQYYYSLPLGLLITDVKEGSAAQEAGVRPGDLLLSLDGSKITGAHVLEDMLYSLEVGDSVEAVIYRSGREYQITLTVEEAQK